LVTSKIVNTIFPEICKFFAPPGQQKPPIYNGLERQENHKGAKNSTIDALKSGIRTVLRVIAAENSIAAGGQKSGKSA